MYGKDEEAPVIINRCRRFRSVANIQHCVTISNGAMMIVSVCSNLNHVFGISSKDWVEDEVAQPSMLRRTVVTEINKVLNVIVRPDIAKLLIERKIITLVML